MSDRSAAHATQPRLETLARLGALRWSSPNTADLASSIGGFVLAALTAFGGLALAGLHDDRGHEFWVDALVIAESAVLASTPSTDARENRLGLFGLSV